MERRGIKFWVLKVPNLQDSTASSIDAEFLSRGTRILGDAIYSVGESVTTAFVRSPELTEVLRTGPFRNLAIEVLRVGSRAGCRWAFCSCLQLAR